MRRNVWLILCLTLAMWAAAFRPTPAQTPKGAGGPAPRADAAAQPAARQAPPPIDPTGQRMEQLLGLWAKHSDQLQSLDLEIRRIDRSPAWGDEEYRGRAMFKAPNKAWLNFEKVDPKNKKAVPHERIVCTGNEVWQYRSDAKQIFVYKLGAQAQKRALQEGPLPFLFNFRADEARQRYQMKLVQQDDQSYVIDIFPMLKIDRECFSSARIKLDRSTYLPSLIVLVDPEQKNVKYFVISNIHRNTRVMDQNFVGQSVKGWTVHVNDEENEAPAASTAAAGRPAPAAAPRQAAPRQAQKKRGYFN